MNPLQKLIEKIPKNTIGIYKITSPSGKVYIGQSRCVRRRLWSYANHSYLAREQPRLHNSFKKYGVVCHEMTLIETCSFKDLNVRERYWQDCYEVLGKMGLNCVLTATDTLPTIISEETKLKRREKSLGRKNSPEHIAKCRAFMLSDLNPNRGCKRSEETKLRISTSLVNSENLPRIMIFNVETKAIYRSIKAAALNEKIAYSTLKHQFCGRKVYKKELVRLSIVC